ncbi:MAG: hypothetical protein JO372_05915 [Solirubrobacterales bacterium]|nr:hypothetical protein [Solirubrobacterales bacterium]
MRRPGSWRSCSRSAPSAPRWSRIRQLTPRNWGNSLGDCILRINAWLRAWRGFFGIASVTEMQVMRKIDAHIRRRLRSIILRHWKRNAQSLSASSRSVSTRGRCGIRSTGAAGLGGR